MKTLKLRKYQEETVSALYGAWERGLKRPAVILPTGMGKTVIFAELIKRTVEAGQRPIVLVHRDELVKQTVQKVHDAAPGATVGVIKGARQETSGDVIVASVATIGRKNRLESLPADLVDLVIIDECHHAAAQSYLNVLTWFGCFEPDRGARAAGFTATMERGDSKGLGSVWEEIVYSKDILYGITNGFLTDVKGIQLTVDGMDMATIAKSRGDYQEGALGDALIAAGAGEVIVKGVREHGLRPDGTIRPGILFAPTVATAHAFADEMSAAGIPTRVVVGTTPDEERAEIYAAVRNGELKYIASCMVLTEGFDLPAVEVAVISRCTSSTALYVQMVGRVLRPSLATGKTGALVLDVVGVSGRLPLRSVADLSTAKPKDGESIAEAIVREAKERNEKPPKGLLAGDMGHEMVDLFHRSSSAWMRTHRGVWFIPTRERTVFLWPSPDGLFHPSVSGSKYEIRGGGYLAGATGFELEAAMTWAEDAATQLDPSIAKKSAKWRRKKEEPSDLQLGAAARARITFPEGATKAEASEILSVHYASKMIDKHLPKEVG